MDCPFILHESQIVRMNLDFPLSHSTPIPFPSITIHPIAKQAARKHSLCYAVYPIVILRLLFKVNSTGIISRFGN